MKYFIVGLLALLAQGTFAQAELHGNINEASSGNPLEQASVYFPQLGAGTLTDANGNFEIRNLPAGTYKLVVSIIGYAAFSENIRLTSGDNQRNISLQPSAIEMEEVIVSTPFHKLQRENVMKVEQSPMKALRRIAAPTLAEGIRELNGVEMVSTGVGIGKPVIRGLSANRVLVYTQGIRLENQQFGSEHGLGVNDAGIESVEVIKGPASLLYGSDALGGVLYLNPERYADAGQVKADAGLTGFSNTYGLMANAGAGVSGEKWKFLARVARTSHADYKDGEGTRVTNSRFGEWDLKSGLAYQAGRFKNDFRYNYNLAEPGIPEEIGEQNKDRTPLLPYQRIESHILSNTSEWFLPESSLKLILGYMANNRQEFEEHEEEPLPGPGPIEEEEEGPALDMQLNTLNYNLQYQFGLGLENVETILGMQGMWQTNRNAGEEYLIPDATVADIGLMATSHIHFSQTDLQLGLRYDHRNIQGDATGDVASPEFIPALDRNFGSFNLAAGLRTDLGNGVTGRVNLASGFRAPNLSELASNGTHSGANRFEIGNADLVNEKNFQTDVSLEYQNEHLELGVNGFFNRVRDFIFLAPTGDINDGDPVYQYQQEDASLYGGEFGLHLHPHPLDWLHLESNAALVIGSLDNGRDLPLIPPFTWRNTLRLEAGKLGTSLSNAYAFLRLESAFRQERVSPFETETPSYNLVHLGFGAQTEWIGQSLEFRVHVNNLLDETYVAHLSRLKPDGILNPGRNVSLGMTLVL
ncbi:TonB-dependent receptor [Robiginitalea sp. M366]|uniref:TonB-dependent receptor n=1 Tax=Robiginitalea aestuariiviva TaxID=3036903 RepID=UPI00240E51BB|nr:TonB-dependent receptor [Robiginitalea aestuariiviva]MDG1573008.1 TonB-dependent receptor [Robiginitalea aestuariiviva]